jgi:hypothetical protein
MDTPTFPSLTPDTDPSISAKGLFSFNEEAPLLVSDAMNVPGATKFPEVHPYWARKGDDEQLKVQIGYKYPSLEEIKALNLQPNTPDNKVMRGHDLVLMLCSTSRYNKVQKEVEDQTNARLGGLAKKVKEDIKQISKTGGSADGEIVLS